MPSFKLDKYGHLVDLTEWNSEIATEMAIQDGIDLSKEHWEIINLVRDIYLETETTPPMRLLIKAIRSNLDEEMASSRYLYRLFSEGPVRLASKYAGLPKPKHCI